MKGEPSVLDRVYNALYIRNSSHFGQKFARTQSEPVTVDLLHRLFQLTRAHVGYRSESPPRARASEYSRPGDASRFRDDASPPREAHEKNDGLAGYYANLEIPYGSDQETVRAAWKQMMKKYHPDLHGEDPEKRRIAGELTAELTRAYQALVQADTTKA